MDIDELIIWKKNLERNPLMTTGTVGRGVLTRTYPCNISLVMIFIWRRKTLRISVPYLSLMFLLSLILSLPLIFFLPESRKGMW